jgi:hypothetical protein
LRKMRKLQPIAHGTVKRRSRHLSTKATLSLNTKRTLFDGVRDPAVMKQEDEERKAINRTNPFVAIIEDNIRNADSEIVQAMDKHVQDLIDQAKNILITVSKNKSGATCDKLSIQKRIDKVHVAAMDALEHANTAKRDVMIAKDNITRLDNYITTEVVSKAIDPPIATIGQSVQFNLVYGGNISPTWTFVAFKGPNNPLFSSGGTRTHTLNITLGPMNPETNAPNTDVTQNQLYLHLNNLLTMPGNPP